MRRCWAWFSVVVVVNLVAACARPSLESVSAGQVGCSPSEIKIHQYEAGFGIGQSSETWVAYCHNRRFICSKIDSGGDSLSTQVSCKEAIEDAPAGTPGGAEAKPPVPTEPAPPGAAGFTFGADAEHEQRACEGAGFQWSSSGGELTCSGAVVSPGFDAIVSLRLCDGKVCSISISHRPNASWMTTVGDIKDKLVTKYGPPAERVDMVPFECRKDEASFDRCMENGTMRLRFGWSWPSGQRIALVAGQPTMGGSAAVRIEYSKPVASAL